MFETFKVSMSFRESVEFSKLDSLIIKEGLLSCFLFIPYSYSKYKFSFAAKYTAKFLYWQPYLNA